MYFRKYIFPGVKFDRVHVDLFHGQDSTVPSLYLSSLGMINSMSSEKNFNGASLCLS